MSESIQLVGVEAETVQSSLTCVEKGYFKLKKNPIANYFVRHHARELGGRMSQELFDQDPLTKEFHIEHRRDMKLILAASRACIEFHLCSPQPEDYSHQVTLSEGLDRISVLCRELDEAIA